MVVKHSDDIVNHVGCIYVMYAYVSSGPYPDKNPRGGGGQYIFYKHICDYFLQKNKFKLRISGGVPTPTPPEGTALVFIL